MPTVSVWAFSSSVRPPPLPRATPTTFGRFGAASSTLTSRPGALEPVGDEACDLGLAARAGDEIRVHGVDRDERSRELGDLAHAWSAPSAAYTIS